MRTFLLLTIVLVSSAADADRPRYGRKQNVDIAVPLSSRVRPTPRATPRAAAPVVTADDMLMIEERSQPIRREQEAILTKLIADTPDDDADKPEYMFRLAEHYAMQLRFWRLRATEDAIKRDD